jgi:hypothetical protein
MKKSVLLILVSVLINSCSDDAVKPEHIQWKKLGLDGRIINEMVIKNNGLYVASDNGVYLKNINATDNFEHIGLADKNIEDILVYSPQKILATFVDRSYTTEPALYLTEDGGNTWQEIDHTFGGDGYREPILDLYAGEENTIYGTGFGVVARSDDGGINWEPIWGDWQMLATGVSIVTINPANKDIWAGGQGSIENGFLLRSSNGVDWDSWYDLAPNPTVVKEIVFDRSTNQRIYAGYEGALVSTTDNGQTWNTLIESEENRFFFGLGVSENRAEHVFAAGWIKTYDDQPLILYYSKDHGQNWQSASYPRETFGGVYDMVVVSEEGRERIFLGLYKGGVYEVTVSAKLMTSE